MIPHGFRNLIFVLFLFSLITTCTLFYHVQILDYQCSCTSQATKLIPRNRNLPPPHPFSFYVLELPSNFTTAYHGWVDPLHVGFLNSSYRTLDMEQADLVVVPYYQTKAWELFNGQRNDKDFFIQSYEDKLMKWLQQQPHWKLYGGRDLVFWSEEINPFLTDHLMYINTIPSMKEGLMSMLCELPAPKNFEEAMLFQRQIVIPYRETNPRFISEPHWSSKPKKKFLIQFCGSQSRYDHGKHVRKEILKYLRESEDVHVFTYHEGNFDKNHTIREFLSEHLPFVMKQSVFCISPHGDTPGARRMFDAILANCIPVIVADDIRLPFYGILNYTEFSIKIPEDNIHNLEEILRSIPPATVARMLDKITEVRPYFVWNHPNASDARVMEMIEHELSFRAIAMREHKHWVKLVVEHPQTIKFSTEFKMWQEII